LQPPPASAIPGRLPGEFCQTQPADLSDRKLTRNEGRETWLSPLHGRKISGRLRNLVFLGRFTRISHGRDYLPFQPFPFAAVQSDLDLKLEDNPSVPFCREETTTTPLRLRRLPYPVLDNSQKHAQKEPYISVDRGSSRRPGVIRYPERFRSLALVWLVPPLFAAS